MQKTLHLFLYLLGTIQHPLIISIFFTLLCMVLCEGSSQSSFIGAVY
jgi:hypothetical protein